MTDKRNLDLDLELQLREDDNAPDGSIAYVYGRAVPYDTPTRIGSVEESFAPDAFDPSDVIGKPLNWRHDEPIGVIVSAANEADGLYIGARILDTVQGRDAATLTRAKAVKGLSVGFYPAQSTWNKARTAVRHTAARLLETSLTHMPAYATAGVSVVREEPSMSETTTVETTEVSAQDREAREALATVQYELAQLRAAVDVQGREERHPLAEYRNLQEYAKALATGQEERVVNVSALSEQTGLVPPVWLQDIKGVLDRGRPCINAVGGPMSAGDSGLDIKWPSFAGDLSAIVAAQNEGAEPNSADIDIVVGSATLATYASYNNLTWQVIDRAQPSYVQAHARILMGAYGTETDYAFQAAMWANDVIATGGDYDFSADTTGAGFIEAVWSAAMDVEFATGQPAEVVYVSSSVFRKLAGWSAFNSQNYPVQNTGGTYDGRTLRATVMGLPVVLAREFATDESEDAIVTNRLAIGWAEDGPRMVTAETPASGGRDVAIYGLGVATPFIANGIRSIYNATP
jgi:HK97 family phage prohead protease